MGFFTWLFALLNSSPAGSDAGGLWDPWGTTSGGNTDAGNLWDPWG